MTDMLFTIGQTLSATVVVYGAYLVILVSFFPERRPSTRATAVDERPDIARYIDA